MSVLVLCIGINPVKNQDLSVLVLYNLYPSSYLISILIRFKLCLATATHTPKVGEIYIYIYLTCDQTYANLDV